MARRRDPSCPCGDHGHPHLDHPVPRTQLEERLRRFRAQAGLPPGFKLEWPQQLARTHDRNWRRYAQIAPFARPPIYELAPQTAWLPAAHRQALLAHEVGHELKPKGTEDDADRAARDALGVKIAYDPRWPGKGLQVAVNAPRKKAKKAAKKRKKKATKKKTKKKTTKKPCVMPTIPPPPPQPPSSIEGARFEVGPDPENPKCRMALRAYTPGGGLMAQLNWRLNYRLQRFEICWIWIHPVDRRERVATRLYEWLSRVAAQYGYCLASDTVLKKGSSGFWRKQVREGRAERKGKRYVLCYPPPKKLNPRFAPEVELDPLDGVARFTGGQAPREYPLANEQAVKAFAMGYWQAAGRKPELGAKAVSKAAAKCIYCNTATRKGSLNLEGWWEHAHRTCHREAGGMDW